MTRFAIVALILFSASSASLQTDSTPQTGAAPVAGTSQSAIQGASVSCASTPGQRTQCPANTSSGVALLRSTGPGQCLLGNTSVGGNYYWFDSRNVRSNVQVMNIDRSPVGSVFGFYVGGQKGTTVSAATSFYF